MPKDTNSTIKMQTIDGVIVTSAAYTFLCKCPLHCPESMAYFTPWRSAKNIDFRKRIIHLCAVFVGIMTFNKLRYYVYNLQRQPRNLSYFHLCWDEIFTSYQLYEVSIFDRIRAAQRNVTRCYALRNDVSRKFAFVHRDQWPLAIGSGKFRYAVYTSCRIRLFSLHNHGRFMRMSKAHHQQWTMAFKCKTTTCHDPLKQSNITPFGINRD
ncbi:hypothetical protein EAG_01130 [Camponotus floridanus]|uniref:Uncharacterized protein n=1 Tax=Camponotus floridanus TaxID=104421 RepID=E1ZWN6_CAMFO|nr:hypothetical protein EAG_01130 [Camponotus floridanus]